MHAATPIGFTNAPSMMFLHFFKLCPLIISSVIPSTQVTLSPFLIWNMLMRRFTSYIHNSPISTSITAVNTVLQVFIHAYRPTLSHCLIILLAYAYCIHSCHATAPYITCCQQSFIYCSYGSPSQSPLSSHNSP